MAMNSSSNEEWDYYQCPTGKYLQSKEYLKRKHRPPTPEITGKEEEKREDDPEERIFTFPFRPDPRKKAPATRDPDWPALPTGAPTWGNNRTLASILF